MNHGTRSRGQSDSHDQTGPDVVREDRPAQYGHCQTVDGSQHRTQRREHGELAKRETQETGGDAAGNETAGDDQRLSEKMLE